MRSTSSDLHVWPQQKKLKMIDKAFKPRYTVRMAKRIVWELLGTAQFAGVCHRDCTPAGPRSFLMTAAYELDAEGRNE